MHKTAISVSFILILASLLGFLNQLIIVHSFGSAVNTDIYFSILAIPSIIYGIAPIIFSALLIPQLSKCKQKGEDITELATFLFTKIIKVIFYIILIGIFLTPYFIKYFFVNTYEVPVEKINFLIWLSTALSVSANYFGILQNLNKKFLFVTLLTCLLPLITIISISLMGNFLGVLSIAIGQFVGNLITFLILMPKRLFIFSFKANIVITGLKIYNDIKSKAIPVFITLLPFTIFPSLTVIWASRLPEGSISYLSYSQNLSGFLSIATGLGVATVSFPALSETFYRIEIKKTVNTFNLLLRNVFLISSIGALLLILNQKSILEILYLNAKFDSVDINRMSRILPWYLLGAVAIACLNLVRNAFFLLSKINLLATISIFVPLVFLLLSYTLIFHHSYIGVGIAFAISFTLFLLIAAVNLKISKVNILQKKTVSFFLQFFLILLLIGFLLKKIIHLLQTFFEMNNYQVLFIGLSVPLLVLFLIFRFFIKNEEASALFNLLLKVKLFR